MLFHTFVSQNERRKFGGSDFMELQLCKLNRGTEFGKIVSNEAIKHWKNDSLYIYGDNMEEFYAVYGEIFRDGYYGNGERGMVDCCGINYYTWEQTIAITEKLKKEKPKDFQVLLDWLADAEAYNGMYLLGV